ncbi:restriction endonuclease subunit S [Thiopseudomonas alkaliphila]|uniref:restriction endonuclease subunit S n=1 Tax=Thiopseudomonas alkaliphila TaxID=1697053 RepID=UPI002576BBF4|nr:restriction endonuclease subunit S [Thiopseudomonas alkaliphila]MDM1708102.1 restriction endonuclease subunit S [Thiopseudomonas alkaliphila]
MGAKRERYTPNDVGPSPLEWSAPRLSEVSTLITNGFVGTATPFYTDSTGIPYLYGTNVRANKLELDDVRYITKEFHEAQSKTALKSGDLLTVQSGHIGETAVVTSQLDGSNCHALIVTRLKKEKAYPEFLSYYINSEIGRARMKGLEVGSTILHINTKDLKKFRVLLPSIPEQKKIAQILSTWDKAITTTEQLLANSQQQKKALMQQLLTGKKRLLDKNGVRFSGEWRECLVEDFFDVGSSKRVLQKDWQFEGVPFYRTRELVSLSKNEPFRSEIFISEELFSDLSEKYGCPQEGDFLVSGVGTLGISYQVKNGDRFYFKDGNVLWFKIKAGVHSDFFRYSFQSDFMQDQITAQASVTTVGTFTIKNAKKTKFLCPPSVDEQQKIAAVLSAADQEITTLQQQLAHLQQEKKALMQQLLTGKRRVNIN